MSMTEVSIHIHILMTMREVQQSTITNIMNITTMIIPWRTKSR